MISENALQVRGQASAQLADAVARFLAAGGTVVKVESSFSNPKPIPFIQPCAAPKKERKSRAKPPGEKLPRRPSAADLRRREQDIKLAEMAKTMTIPEACEATGLSRNSVLGAARRGNFKFIRVELVDHAEDTKYIERIVAMRDQGVTRTTCCRRLDISLTKLWRLLEVGSIDYPTAGPGRPR